MDAHPLSLHRIYRAQPGWYSGDFHCHSNHSDGTLEPAALLDLARAEGLDFFVITDHNRMSPYACFGAPYTRHDLCILPGMEVTGKRGHFNIYGIEYDIDGKASWLAWLCNQKLVFEAEPPGRTLNDLIRLSAAAGLLPSINHPLLAPWAWQEQNTPLSHLRCLEIWNDPSWPDNRRANPAAIALWTAWLNRGYRITALGGSDFHRPDLAPGVTKPPDRLGLPRTYVYAENLSGAALLDAVRQHRVYVSMGPQVKFEARHGGKCYGIGADLGATTGLIELRASIAATSQTGVARLVYNGIPVSETILDGAPCSLSHTIQVDGARAHWYRLDLYTNAGQLLAITNPIFAGPHTTPQPATYGDFLPHVP